MRVFVVIVLACVGAGQLFGGNGNSPGQPGWKEAGGYRLFGKSGNIATTTDAISASTSPEKVINVPMPSSFESGNGLVIRAVTESERIVRRAPPANSTNVQRQQLADKKRNEIQFMIDQVVAKPVTISVAVIDVVERPEPDRNSDAHKLWEAGKWMVVGKVNWMSPATYTDAERKQIAAENKKAEQARQDYANRMREIQKKMIDKEYIQSETNYHRGKASDAKLAIEKECKVKVDAIRLRAEARRPAHMVYVIGSNATLAQWTRGQTRSVKGIMQQVAVFTYNVQAPWKNPDAKASVRIGNEGNPRGSREGFQEEALEAANVGVEAVVWALAE